MGDGDPELKTKVGLHEGRVETTLPSHGPAACSARSKLGPEKLSPEQNLGEGLPGWFPNLGA